VDLKKSVGGRVLRQGGEDLLLKKSGIERKKSFALQAFVGALATERYDWDKYHLSQIMEDSTIDRNSGRGRGTLFVPREAYERKLKPTLIQKKGGLKP